MKQTLLIVLILVLASVSLWYYLAKAYPETQTSKAMLYFAEHLLKPHIQTDKYILGFLPYWRLEDINSIRPNELSEINYFSISVDTDGHFAKVVDGQTDPGWLNWEKQSTKDFVTKSQIMGADVTITVAALNNPLIESILDSKTMQQNLISDIVNEVKTRRLDGVNIDFEYIGEPDPHYQQAFTNFSKNLKTKLKQEVPKAHLSLSIMPLAASQDDIYDFDKLVPMYDRFVGMSYDYYGQNADIAGPIAPLYGFKENKYFYDVSSTYEDYRKYIPKDKILMGVPFYGWEWAVVDGKTINSSTLSADDPNSTAVVISYTRGRKSKDIKKNQCQWDTYAQQTWCWFTDKTSGVDHQVWLADDRFVQTRLDYAKKENFAGVAIWTLGLDKGYSNLWQRIRTTFSK